MSWELSFISEKDFIYHVKATIDKYGEKLESFDIVRFNRNIIDPIKMIFDKTVYQASWEEIVSNEIFRQRDKSNNNDIGYFHQRIFQYIADCHVPDNGKEGGWDVILQKEAGILLPDGDKVSRVYVEMKNKHNTMNSSASAKTYIKMQNQLLKDDDCACFLVEAIAKQSQNIKWTTTVDGENVSHRRIRRVSLDQFYALVTGQEDAFYKICIALPKVIEKVITEGGDNVKVPHDTVLSELQGIAGLTGEQDKNLAMALAIYLLGFSTYSGFSNVALNVGGNEGDKRIKRLYEYVKKMKM
ncbi:MAG: Eco47II family restriction endonuclease [Lachnospiraceae bacterium]|nr:Eco47II family restriction endonuclease [Lachnospiraceae bacterium]